MGSWTGVRNGRNAWKSTKPLKKRFAYEGKAGPDIYIAKAYRYGTFCRSGVSQFNVTASQQERVLE